jgi:hypothetical protein
MDHRAYRTPIPGRSPARTGYPSLQQDGGAPRRHQAAFAADVACGAAHDLMLCPDPTVQDARRPRAKGGG